MIIANPIYDIVLKKLMENLDIARGILECILNTRIEQLDFASQELTTTSEEHLLTYFRMDFKARIATSEGSKNVLIEMQKGKLAMDVDRFRAYLGEEYRRLCEVREADGEVHRRGLPIITIYFFGYPIDPRLPGAFKIDRRYLDLITGEELGVRSDVMERLTHDAYVVQITRLGDQQRNAVEELLAIFRQDHPADEAGHTLIVEEDGGHSALVTDILYNLRRLVEKKEVKDQMAIEDEMYEALARGIEEETREIKIAMRELERKSEELQRERQKEQRERKKEQRKREEIERKYAEAAAEIARLRQLSANTE